MSSDRRLPAQHPARPDDKRRARAPGDVAQGAILGHRDLHLRAGARDRRCPRTRRAADPAAQCRNRRHVGGRGRRPGWRRVVLHRTAEPGRESVPNRQRAVHDSGLLAENQFGRIRLFVNGENLTGVRQTRWDPLLLQTTRRRRPLDRRCVGTARGPQHQRRPARPFLEAAGRAPSRFEALVLVGPP